MRTDEKQSNNFLETLKSNYKRRIEETDKFSRNFSSSSADFRSQYLAGLSDMLQHYLDLQKKFVRNYPLWYESDLMNRQSKMITEVWIDTMRNLGSFYSSMLDYGTKNMRIFHQGMMQMMQMAEMLQDASEKVSPIQRNALVDLIKQAKKHNEDVQKPLPEKTVYSGKDKKKQIVTKAS